LQVKFFFKDLRPDMSSKILPFHMSAQAARRLAARALERPLPSAESLVEPALLIVARQDLELPLPVLLTAAIQGALRSLLEPRETLRIALAGNATALQARDSSPLPPEARMLHEWCFANPRMRFSMVAGLPELMQVYAEAQDQDLVACLASGDWLPHAEAALLVIGPASPQQLRPLAHHVQDWPRDFSPGAAGTAGSDAPE
jgi:hypothetical protein